MHDIKFIRQNPEIFDEGMKRRGLPMQSARILELDEKKRGIQTSIENWKSSLNKISKEIGIAKSKGDEAKVSELREQIANAGVQVTENELLELETELKNILESLPNIPADDVPIGKDETANVAVRTYGNIPKFDFAPKQHFEIGEKLGLMDFEAAAKISGARFVVLKGALAKMERALGNFMLDMHTKEFGYTEVAPPFLVKDSAMYGVGQLPKFAEDSFATTTNYRLIPTAEVSLTNLVADSIQDETKLPLRYTAFTPCFRSEAGSAGKDTRGIIRQHQFSKVELVSITKPENSEAEHERMTLIAEEILKRLEIPYRVMLLCSGDMGFSAKKTYDLEVWLPGQNTYREISSCSNCGDFQARRMKARFKKPGDKETRFVHTLNGSALAVGRTIIAILENYQNKDGSVNVPKALQKYMDGMELIK